jgi:putative isomerase
MLTPQASPTSAKNTPPNIRDYFEWENEAVIQLVESVFAKCVFGKIHPPEGELKRRWNSPGGGYYGQWLWDTMFVTDLLSIFPSQREVIHDVFGNYRDFQQRWNAAQPKYMHDMIPCMIKADDKSQQWKTFPAYSQIPILAWGLERIYNRNGDIELVKENLQSLERFHEWYWRERDVTNAALIALGDYSGDIQNARYETYDFDRTLDHLQLTPHPRRKDNPPLKAYGNILVTGNTSYLILAEQSLARLAKITGNTQVAQRCEARAARAAESMRKNMWDEKDGVFKAIHRDSFQKINELSIGCWMPLLAGVPTAEQATKMAAVLQSPAWNTPIPVPTVPTTDPIYKPDAFWRGDVWTVTNYQIAHGLKAYGFNDLAAHIADKTIELSLLQGVSEHHNSQTGQALGVDFLGMSCTVITLMLEGISQKYILKLKNN